MRKLGLLVIRHTVLLALLLLIGLSGHEPGTTERAYAEEDEVFIRIDIAKNRLYIVLNDTPVYQFRVATGRLNRPTPTGTFKIVTKVAKPFYLPKRIPGGDPTNPLGSRWLGLSIGNGYKYGIHGTHRPSLIGQSVSSGCIRMRNQDIEFLYRHIPLRTTVVIIDSRHLPPDQ